jgi:hypothetical protein
MESVNTSQKKKLCLICGNNESGGHFSSSACRACAGLLDLSRAKLFKQIKNSHYKLISYVLQLFFGEAFLSNENIYV